MTRRRGSRNSFDWAGLETLSVGEDELITPAQCRMARAGIVMSVRELARLADVSGLEVTRFENGNEGALPEIVRRFRLILESRGVRFLDGSEGGGVEITE